MKLVFKKDDDAQISVFQNVDNQEKDFSYVEMIKTLIGVKSMEKPEILGDFTEAEKNSINSMVKNINEVLSDSEQPDPLT